MSDELRNLVRGSAENVPVPAEDIGDVVRGGRSLKWRKRLYTGGVVALVAVLAWTAVPALTSAQRDEDPPPITGTPSPSPSRGNCGLVEFRATWLPDGWSYAFNEGSGGQRGVPPEDQSPRAMGHFTTITGGNDQPAPFVDIFRYGDTYTLPPSEADWEPIKVLGEFGKIGEIHDGYAVEFHSGGCEYSMVGFGVTMGELADMARGLKWADRCPRERLAGPDIPIEDGKHFGYIEGITDTAIQFDEAEFLSGEEANEAAVASGAIEEGDVVPNDYFIQNEDKSSGALSLSKDVRVIIETVSMTGSVGPAPADVAWLVCNFQSRDRFEASHARSPWWITVENGMVTKIEEQYLP